jgi:hypothetical protein
MAGLVPAIHVLNVARSQVVDARHKAGHDEGEIYEHPVVDPHVSHFMQVPLRTSVKLPHSPQASPS